MKKNLMYDKWILFLTIALVLIGVIMVYSASEVWAAYKFGDDKFYLYRQLIFAIFGIVLMLFISKIPYTIYKVNATKIFLLSVLLLILVLVPGIGVVRGGARSWIGIGAFSIQPSEFSKLAVIILLSKYFSNYYGDMKKFKNFVMILIIIIGVFALIMLQPDFGTGIVIVLSSLILLFIVGVPLKYFFYFSLFGATGLVGLIISAPYRLKRIVAFLDPWSDPLGSGFQIIQSLYAIAPGGIFGTGLFESRQKYFYLPEPQTDFIFSIIVEELGFIGALLILSLYFLLIVRGIFIAFEAKDRFASFLALGIIAILFVQVFINIGVVIGLLPVTGITLPLISYGGSSLVISLIGFGILLNISRYNNKE